MKISQLLLFTFSVCSAGYCQTATEIVSLVQDKLSNTKAIIATTLNKIDDTEVGLNIEETTEMKCSLHGSEMIYETMIFVSNSSYSFAIDLEEKEYRITEISDADTPLWEIMNLILYDVAPELEETDTTESTYKLSYQVEENGEKFMFVAWVDKVSHLVTKYGFFEDASTVLVSLSNIDLSVELDVDYFKFSHERFQEYQDKFHQFNPNKSFIPPPPPKPQED